MPEKDEMTEEPEMAGRFLIWIIPIGGAIFLSVMLGILYLSIWVGLVTFIILVVVVGIVVGSLLRRWNDATTK